MIHAFCHPIFTTGVLRNGSFIPEHAGRQKDMIKWRNFENQNLSLSIISIPTQDFPPPEVYAWCKLWVYSRDVSMMYILLFIPNYRDIKRRYQQ